jgi:NAD(P)-dependent dehydrogenase (short-subunit alcohol dehydrogenase family)
VRVQRAAHSCPRLLNSAVRQIKEDFVAIQVAGRTAFITGAANGIGLGIARAFARAGASLALADIEEGALEKAKAELSKLCRVETFLLDVRDRDGFEAAAREAEAKLGAVSLLFNNAGVAGGAPAGRLSYELWDWGLDINLGGVVNGVQTFLPRMLAAGNGGHIVHTASGAGLATTGHSGVLYQTAKYAVVGMAEALALELSTDGIGVSVLCPGPVATGIIERTRSMQPRVTRSFSTEQLSNAREQSDYMRTSLLNGSPPDAVGEQVLDAVRNNRLYILTDPTIGPFVESRAKAILDAVPASLTQ